jgi:hypothetical protein
LSWGGGRLAVTEPTAIADVDRTKIALLGPSYDELVTLDDAFVGSVVSVTTIWVEVGWTDSRPLFPLVGLLAVVEVFGDLSYCKILA